VTTGARLAELSGLSGVSALDHLKALASGATTGARLIARSGLPTGSAMDHLVTGTPALGGGSIMFVPLQYEDRQKIDLSAYLCAVSAGVC